MVRQDKGRRNNRESQKNRRVGPEKVSKVEKSIWEGGFKKNADQESLGSHYRS